MRVLQPPRHHVLLALFHFGFQQRFQKSQVAALLFDRLLGQAHALSGHRRHVQPPAGLLDGGHVHGCLRLAHWITSVSSRVGQQSVVVVQARLRPFIAAEPAHIQRLAGGPLLQLRHLQQIPDHPHIRTTHGHSLVHGLAQAVVSVLPPQQQHVDHGPRAIRFPAALLEIRPELVEALRPATLRPPLLQRRRSRQGAGLLRQHVQIMLQV